MLVSLRIVALLMLSRLALMDWYAATGLVGYLTLLLDGVMLVAIFLDRDPTLAEKDQLS